MIPLKTEAEPKGVSINSFCINNNIPYTAFYNWFKKTQKKVVPVEVEGIPEELLQAGNEEQQNITKGRSKRTSHNKGSIMVTIRAREGLCIQKKGLDYQGVKTLVEKLEGLF
ncbi:hypothetical protein [uncultured Bacteroides sp.]|uniref:hypothetical protein n=1 Tax=uncultured Bacteroides sp. TaxID=162156 RepID=UPI002604AA1A|nr:hypothetical protein [uncultured Bacteroides sp.]